MNAIQEVLRNGWIDENSTGKLLQRAEDELLAMTTELARLQRAEQERDELRTALKWAMYIIENEVEVTDKTKHDFATAALKGE